MNKLIKTLLIFFVVIPALIFGFIDKPIQMGIWAAIGLIAIVIINFEKFESFSISQNSINAKLRKADKLIEEVHATLDDLKNTTKPLMAYNLAHMVRGHTFIGISARDKIALYRNIKLLVKDLKIDDPRINELLEQAIIIIRLQFPEDTLGIIENEFGYEKFQQVIDDFKKIEGNGKIIKAIDLRGYFESNQQIYTDEIKLILDMYDEFNKEINPAD